VVAKGNQNGVEELTMPTTITVKGIPDELYRRLKAAAEANHRSINSEIINRIDASLMSRKLSAAELLSRVRQLHASFEGRTFDLSQLDAARREGRP
jgi:antitoxin FitA